LSQQDPKNNQNSNFDLLEGLLYMNRALTYEIFPSLRTVQLKWDAEKIYIFFFYNGEISEDDSESAECVATQMISNFNNLLLEIEMVRLDDPAPIPKIGITAYHRYEASIDLHIEQNQVKELLKNNPDISSKVKILIAIIVGSLGKIYSSLRSLQVNWSNENIYLYFYSEGEVSQLEIILSASVTEYVASCLPNYIVKYENTRWDFPKKIPIENTITTYYRKERVL